MVFFGMACSLRNSCKPPSYRPLIRRVLMGLIRQPAPRSSQMGNA
jgi:hypothetical protein